MNQQHIYEIPMIVRAKSDGKKSEAILMKPEGSKSIGHEFKSKYLHQQDFSIGLFLLDGIGIVSLHYKCIPLRLAQFDFDPPFDREFKFNLNVKIVEDRGEIDLEAFSSDNKIEYGSRITVLDSKVFSVHLGEIEGKICAILYFPDDDPIRLEVEN